MILVKRVRVDKTMAELFLSYEKQPTPGQAGTNRKPSAAVVNNYAFDMLSGNWRTTHQGLAFKGYMSDNTAEYVDGGQRARAVIQAATVGATMGGVKLKPNPEISFEFLVSEGLDDADVEALDSGKRRLPADSLTMRGEVDANVMSSVLNLCYLYENVPWSPENWRKFKITAHMRNQYLSENPRVRDAIAEGRRLGSIMTVSAAATGWHQAIKAGLDEKAVNEFMDAMFTGASIDKGNPILTLRELLLKAKDGKRRYDRAEQLALFVKSLMKWINGVESHNLSFKTGGEAPDRFPRFSSK